MKYPINKQILFNFFKSQGIVKKIEEKIEIVEEKNKNKPDTLYKVTILLENNEYWQIVPENPTVIRPNKQTETIIVEFENSNLNLYFIEMKSKNSADILQKLERTFSWFYLLLNLLSNEKHKSFSLYYIVCKRKESEDKCLKERLLVFDSLDIRYKKFLFYTTENNFNFNILDLKKLKCGKEI